MNDRVVQEVKDWSRKACMLASSCFICCRVPVMFWYHDVLYRDSIMPRHWETTSVLMDVTCDDVAFWLKIFTGYSRQLQ